MTRRRGKTANRLSRVSPRDGSPDRKNFTAKQLCYLSRDDRHRSISERTHIPHHGIQDGQELAHTSHDCHFLQFALAEQMMIKMTNGWIETNRGNGCHV